MKKWLFAACLLACLSCSAAWARGVSPYLPLNLSPAIERQIERVLILAGKPVMSRPIAAATVLDALPEACRADRALCEEVRNYLRKYMHSWGITSARVEGAITDGDSGVPIPNRHGQPVDSSWQASASAYAQWGDYLILNVGGIANDEDTIATGSFLSLGFDFAQLDIGYRDHWLSPLTDSSSLISTEAHTMPSITLSNYKPLTPLGISYQIFAAEMSRQEGIHFEDTTTSGHPRLAGLQLTIEPVPGLGLAFNRVVQYGGGARSNGSEWSDFWNALVGTSNELDAQGHSQDGANKVASLTASVLFPGRVPFGVYIEYAGEDNTYEGEYRLGDTNLSLGLDFPVLWTDFDASYEVSEWQTGWYVHGLYPLGLTNDGNVIGHWFGDERLFGDAIGGRSQMLRVGWSVPWGGYAQAKYRNLDLDTRWAFDGGDRPYKLMQMLELSYSTAWRGFGIDAGVQVGKDVFGDSFARIVAAFDFAKDGLSSGGGGFEATQNSGVEIFVDAGGQYTRNREYLLLQYHQRETSQYEAGYHLGVGARRPVSEHSDIGVRLEMDEVVGSNLLSLRAVDYRYRAGRKLAVGGFAGVARYDLNLPAYGYYFGVGFQYRDVVPGWDIGLDYRRYDKLTRDKGLPSDPESNPGLPRRVLDIDGISLYVSKRW